MSGSTDAIVLRGYKKEFGEDGVLRSNVIEWTVAARKHIECIVIRVALLYGLPLSGFKESISKQ